MIAKYNITNPILNKNLPYYIKSSNTFYFKLNRNYNYYLIGDRFNENTGDIDFYILLGKTQFDDNCKRIQCDNYGRYKFKPIGIFKKFILNELTNRVNFNLEYVESEEQFDVYLIE